MEFLFQLRGGVLILLGKVLKTVGIALAGLVGLCLLAVLAVLIRPELVVNDRMLPVAARLAARAGVEIHWNRAHVGIESRGLLRKRVRLEFGGVCVRIPAAGLDACADRLDAGVAGGLVRLKPRLTELGPVDLRGGRVAIVPPKSEAPAPRPPRPEKRPVARTRPRSLIPMFLLQARMLPVHVDVPQWSVGEGPEVAGSLRVDSPGDWKVALQADARLKSAARAAVHGEIRPAGGTLRQGITALDYDLKASFRQGKGRAQADVSGNAASDRITARFSGEGRGWSSVFERFWVRDCEAALRVEGSGAALTTRCPVRARVPVPPAGFPPLALPTEAGVQLIADVRSSSFPPAADSLLDGKAEVMLDPVLTPIFAGGGDVESRFEGVPREYPRNWNVDTELGLHLSIVDFARLVHELEGTPWAVWAPLRVLKGTVEIDAKGKFDANSGVVPLTLKTSLASRAQKLGLDADGQLQLKRLLPEPRLELDADLKLSEVRLELPPLPNLPTPTKPAPDPMPQLLPDGRIKRLQEQPASAQLAGKVPSGFGYRVRVHTVDDQHPVQLLTSQIKAPIPVALDLRIANEGPPTGQVRVLSFPLELFKRDVTLDHVDVSLAQPSKDSALNGKITIPYTDYTITVLVLGTLEKPQLRFLSDPPLPDDQIVAVLVFGQSLDSLDPDQQASVGNSRAALRQGALSLFSLYYLSSLNIESVDYDPETHVASLRYRIAEGTSLNVSQGVGGGQPSVGVRKRLSKHFAVTTTLNNPSEQQTQRTVSTYLEWAYQY